MARPIRTEPTTLQRELLGLIAREVAAGQPSPSFPELAKAIGARSPGSTRYNCVGLEGMGLLGRTGAADRFYVPTSAGWHLLGMEPPPGSPSPATSTESAIVGAVREAFAASEPLPPRVLAAMAEVA